MKNRKHVWFKVVLTDKYWKVALILNLAKLIGVKVEYYSGGF